MTLPDICIRRPVFTIVLSLIIVTLGGIFYTRLQVRETPNIMPPIVSVKAQYDGADPLYMEKQIATRIEKQLKTVKNLDYMSSTSSVGESDITLVFKLDTDIEVALNDVRSKVSDISSIFPDDMQMPSVSKLDSDSWPSLWISVNSERHTALELTRIVDDQIKIALEKLPTVGDSLIFGGRYYTMQIEPDNVKLYQHKISPFEIEQAIVAQNKDYPAGTIKSDVRNFTLKLTASLNNPEEFENIIVKKYPDGTLVKLKDIAKVLLEPMENDVILRYNGKRSMALGLVKQSTANILELSDDVKAMLPKIRNNLPAGVQVEIAHDDALPVKESIKQLFRTIFEAIILVGLVTYIFLASARITLIPLVTIPISLVGTFTVMYFLGFSINTFTLLAMILAIGLVVDDAIVVLENIFRHTHELGKKPIQAAVDASKEIGFAVVAMTITLASVFLPIGFIEGFLGKLFIEFAWTLAFCVLFSGFVALTLTPMMSSRLISESKKSKPKLLQIFDYYFVKTQNYYLSKLELSFSKKKQFFLICLSSVVFLFVGFKHVHKAFVPEEDKAFLQVIFSGPEGSSVAESEKSVLQAEEILKQDKDVFGFFAVIGWGGGESAMAFVPLTSWDLRTRNHNQIKADLNAKFAKIPGMSIFAISPRSLGNGGVDKMVQFNLQSSLEFEELDILSAEFVKALQANPLFSNVERDFKASTPTLDIVVDRDRAYEYGVRLDVIGKTVQYLISGRRVGDFRMGNDIYDVIVKFASQDRSRPDDLSRILVKTDEGIMLPLQSVADIIEKISVKSYTHYNSAKSVGITSDLAPDKTLPEAVKEIEKIADKLIDKNSTIIEYLGQIKQMNESFGGTLITFVFALIFIFLVLSAQFESFLDSLLILLAVPFSITGGVLTLWLFGNSINMYSNIGLVTLIGLITKNSIMLVEFSDQLREQGMKVKDAVLTSAKLRFRPILMTSIATIFGALPLAFATGAGAESRNSIGLVIVGGMFVGTIFTIFVIPVLYQTFKKETN